MTDALAIRPGPGRRPPRLTFCAPGEASVTLHPSSCMASAGRTNNPWLGWPVLCPVVGAVVTGLTTHDRISNTFGLRPTGNPVTCMGSTPQTSTGTRCCPRRAWSACRCGGDVSQWHQTPGTNDLGRLSRLHRLICTSALVPVNRNPSAKRSKTAVRT